MSDTRLVGWRVRRTVGKCVQYATGLGRIGDGTKAWTEERRRAYLFTNVGSLRGLDNGLRWARAHAKDLEGKGWHKRGVRIMRVLTKGAP